MHPVRTVARAMLASIFVVQGAEALAHPEPLMERARRVTDRVGPLLGNVHPDLPADARSLVRLNAAVMVTGGALLVTPLHRPAALAVVASLVPTTLAAHSYWEHSDPAQRKQQRVQFLKNLGLLGGLLLAAADSEGRPGLGWRTRHLLSHQRRLRSRIAT
jgi:putative oxidoreductase